MHYLERWAQRPLFVISKRYESSNESPITGIEGLRMAFARLWNMESKTADVPDWLASNDAFRDHIIQVVGDTSLADEMFKSAPEAFQAAPPIGEIFETSIQASGDLLPPAAPFTPVTIEIPFHLG